MTNIIVLEGVDGCGKTTLATSLEVILNENGYTCQIIREPDTYFKQIIEKPKESKLTNLFLFLANRCETVDRIKRLQNESELDFIILDRFFISTLVYQSIETGLSVENLSNLISFTLQGVRVDFFYYLNNTEEQIIQNLKDKNEFTPEDTFKTKALKTIYHLVNKFYLRNENIIYLYDPQNTFAYQVIEDLRLNGFAFKNPNL